MTGGPCNSDPRFSAYSFGSLAVHANLRADNAMQYFNFGPHFLLSTVLFVIRSLAVTTLNLGRSNYRCRYVVVNYL